MRVSQWKSDVLSIVHDDPGWLTRLESDLSNDGSDAESTELDRQSQRLSPSPSPGQSTPTDRHRVGPGVRPLDLTSCAV